MPRSIVVLWSRTDELRNVSVGARVAAPRVRHSKMGAVMAQTKGLISFAPGYPAEDLFAWDAFAAIARELMTGADGKVLHTGPRADIVRCSS